MESLLYLLIWVAMIFVMMRMGCGKHVMGNGHDKNPQSGSGENPGEDNKAALYWEPPAKDIDPACGKAVATSQAKPSVFEGKVYYFCSRECREAFEAAPDIYLSENPKPTRERLGHSHG